MKMLRLEAVPGHGIYNYSVISESDLAYHKVKSVSRRLESMTETNNLRPVPIHDPLLLKSMGFTWMDAYEEFKNYFFGFKNEDQLNNWFSDKFGILKIIGEMGVTLAVYDVPHAYIGSTQACAKIKYKKSENVRSRLNLLECINSEYKINRLDL